MSSYKDRHLRAVGPLPEDVPIGVTLDLTCPSCDQTFPWTSEPGYQWPRTYCTKNCKNRATRKRARTHRFALDAITPEVASGDLRLLVCALCEEPFGWLPLGDGSSVDGPPMYCSVACKERAKRHRKKARKESAATSKAAVTTESARIVAMSEAARFLMLPAGRCVTCGKVANPTEAAAKDAKRAIEKRSGRTNEVRYYQCPDGWWHWTRMGADLETWRAERLMTESPASLRHWGRGGWAHLGETR